MQLYPKQRNTKRKPVSKRKIAIRAGVGALVIGAALSFVGRSMEKSKIDQLARAGDLKAKPVLVSKTSLQRANYVNKYPSISNDQIAKERGEIKKILRLNLNKDADKRAESIILKVAKEAGVSPRVALRTLARSSGKSSSMNAEINKLRLSVQEFEEQGNFNKANEANKVLQEKEKIQLILIRFEQIDAVSRSEFLSRISGY